jgi:hypothetical protein
MTDPTTDITTFLDTWASAECKGDHEKLDHLLAADFTGVGPLGFVLPRPAWLQRYTSGALSYESFTLDEVTIQPLGASAAVVTARQDTVGAFGGHAVPPAVRVTLVLSRPADEWQLVHNHISFIAGTPGSPPLPGRP